MTRAAFLGNLEIDNGNPTNLTNLSVVLQVKDANGNIINELFGITTPILSNITAVDGTGILTGDDPNTPQDEGIGSAKWTFIPTNLAAPATPTTYTIGGTLSYTENGQNITVPLLSTPITVFPQAELYLDYFHQRDVFADDPFTDDVVETSVPYSLAVLVRNDGKGDAKNLRITSGQPKIVDNEKGLLIDFQIIGSEVNGTGVSPSLTANFDDFLADTRFSQIKGQGSSIVTIDTGADLNHPLFGPDANNDGIADKIVYQYDFADNDNDASDRNNHGSQHRHHPRPRR